MPALPDVLAGPVLRRCSADEVFVWVAFSREITLELEIYDAKAIPDLASGIKGRSGLSIGASYPTSPHSSSPKPNGNVVHLEAGRNLHVYLLRAVPLKGSFPPDVTLAYEVYALEPLPQNTDPATGDTNAIANLKHRRSGLCEHLRANESGSAKRSGSAVVPLYQRGYSDDPRLKIRSTKDTPNVFPAELRPNPLIRFSYGNDRDSATYHFPLPTFVLQGKGELRAWAASCMKPHAPPDSASLLMYDETAKRPDEAGQLPIGAYNVKQRPHCLLLMGDQIYADDVPFLLFTGVRRLRPLLMGEDEKAPLSASPSVDKLDSQDRRIYVERRNPFSPLSLEDYVHNQLFSFGEYAAYYLMCLNPALCLDLSQALPEAEVLLSRLEHWSGKDRRLAIERDRLVRNLPALRDFATVLANVPTYAICDDHEVTDDWFLDRDWIEFRPNVNAKKSKPAPRTEDTATPSPIAQYIVASGLYAYSVFQGLGNNPAAVTRTLSATRRPTDKTSVDVLHQLLAAPWSFATPTTPPIVFLDTRTKRRGRGTSKYALALRALDTTIDPSSPQAYPRELPQMMMSDPEAIREAVSPHRFGDGRLLLVTPSPVLSSDEIELRAKSFEVFHHIHLRRDHRATDDELWRTNLSNYFMLMKELEQAGIKRLTVISGDVHYGYRRGASLTTCNGQSRKPLMEIDQIVSSPLLNPYESKYGQGGHKTLRIIQEYFNADYAITKRFSRANGNREDPGNAWKIDRLDKARELTALPWIEEKMSPVECQQANGEHTKGIITESHFVELFISTQDIKTIYYVKPRRPDRV